MDKQSQEQEHEHTASNAMRMVAGLLVGGLVGAGVTLLLAPQSGKRTRAQIQQKSIELRGQASDSMDDAVVQVRVKARQIKADVRDKAEELQLRGQEMVVEQMDRVSAALDGGKKAVQGT
jgi:gas vesicle protein